MPPVKNEGLFTIAGLPDPEPPVPPAAAFVAIAVGKTKEGESLPANPSRNQRWHGKIIRLLPPAYLALRNLYRYMRVN